MSDKPKILITGASGLLGEALCRAALGRWSVIGIHFQHPSNLEGIVSIQADLTDDSRTADLLSRLDPQAVVHAAAVSQPAVCEMEPQSSAAVNVHLPELLARLCADRKIPFIFTSSDLVFDGRQAPYDERAPVSPLCAYGRQKARAEKAVSECYPEALVCRMPLMFGPGARSASNFTSQMLVALSHGQPLDLFTDEYRTPVDTTSAARGLLNVLGRARGVLHMGGRSRVSRYDLGVMMAGRLGAPLELLRPVSVDSFKLSVARSPDCTLDSSKAYGLGYDPMPLSDAIKKVVAYFKTGRRRKEPRP